MSNFHAAWANESMKASEDWRMDTLAGMWNLTREPGETTEQLAERLAHYLATHWDGTPVEPIETPKGQDLSVPCRYWLGTGCVRNPCKCTCPETGDGELA